MNGKFTLFITQTAVMLALLITAQFVTRSVGQLLTGSLVNFILLASTLLIGVRGGLCVGLLSPFFAAFLGMGPAFIQIVPFVAVANAILVSVAGLGRKRLFEGTFTGVAFAAAGFALAAAAKVAFLWVGLVLVALPLIPGIKEQQIAVISAAFTWPQIITALIGGALALAVAPLVKRGIRDLA